MKRFPNKTVGLGAVVLFALLHSCSTNSVDEKVEIKQVEETLAQIERTGPEDRAVLLDDLSQTALRSEAVAQMRDACVAAYQAFYEAKREMRKAKEMTASLEQEITQQNAVADDGEGMIAKAAAATRALEASDKALARADALLESCAARRRALKQQ